MHKRSCFWKLFGSEHINESLNLLKSAEKYFHPTFSSVWVNLDYKKLFLIRPEILGRPVNTLTSYYDYSRSNRDKLRLRVQMQIPGKLQAFFRFLIAFLESALNVEHFEKKKNK